MRLRLFQAGIRWTPSWRSTGLQGSSTSGCTRTILFLLHIQWRKLVSSFSPLLLPTTPRFVWRSQNCTIAYLPYEINSYWCDKWRKLPTCNSTTWRKYCSSPGLSLEKVQYVRFLVGNIQNYQQEGDSSVTASWVHRLPAAHLFWV